jgi:hypothetical protein
MKISNSKNTLYFNYDFLLIALVFLLLIHCSSNMNTKLEVLESKIERALPKDYSPPNNIYYEKMSQLLLIFNSLVSDKQQLRTYSFIKSKESSLLKALCRSFRHCVIEVAKKSRDNLDSIYNQKLLTDELSPTSKDSIKTKLEQQKEQMFIWMMGINDTIAFFNHELITIIKKIEFEHQYFKKNCQSWAPFLKHLQIHYDIPIVNLPCDIKNILNINGLKLLEDLEDTLLNRFDTKLHDVLWREEQSD